MSDEIYAGLLLTKMKNKRRVYLLAHPGGPFFARQNEGIWSLPKGKRDKNEDILMTAYRAFRETIGAFSPSSDAMILLGHTRLKSGREIYAFLAEGDFIASSQKSKMYEAQWPPNSQRLQKFPKVDRSNWFSGEKSKRMLHPSQTLFIDRAEAALLDEAPS